MKIGKNNGHGFTIVELLIVIVIIGVLAGIVITTFRGLQQRAYNTARVQNAKKALTVLNGYTAANGQSPFSTNTGRCVGTNFPDGKCWGVNSASPALESNSTTLNANLSSFGSLPKVSYPTVDMGYWQGIGPVYHYNTTRTVDGELKPAILIYFLDGLNQDCVLGNVLRPIAGTPANTWNTDAYDTYNVSPRNTTSNGAGTYCIVSVDNPQ